MGNWTPIPHYIETVTIIVSRTSHFLKDTDECKFLWTGRQFKFCRSYYYGRVNLWNQLGVTICTFLFDAWSHVQHQMFMFILSCKRQMLTSERNGNKSSAQLTLNLFTITWITASVNKIHQKSFEPFEVLGKFSPVRFSWNERKNSEVTYILGGKSCLGWFIT